jgi:MoxR-like ATPase
MTVETGSPAARFQIAQEQLLQVRETLSAAIVGQEALIDDLTTALFAGGHVLLEGLPGLGKTHLAKGIARCMGLELNRVQCTPDLMPADVMGSEVLINNSSGAQRFDFRPGPLFGHMVLVDEINRATPKTQSAMLEAMQEQQVTVLGQSHPLPQPFWLLATQNPIELEGTYPLPEAQLDRFLFKLRIDFPAREALLAMLDLSLDREPTSDIQPVLSLDEVAALMATSREVIIAQPLKRAVVDLLSSTHPGSAGGSRLAQEHFRYGASPRGLQSMVRAARIKAVAAGRAHISIEDLAAVALPALRHRILLNMDSEVRGIDIDTLLTEHIETWARQL